MGIGYIIDGYTYSEWSIIKSDNVQGSEIGIHHGNAVVPPAELANHRHSGLATLDFLLEKSRHNNSGNIDCGMGFIRSAWGSLQTSYLARLGHWIEPVGRLMGLDWRLTVALLTSFMAKENAIATLGVLFGEQWGQPGATVVCHLLHATALSFLTVSILFIPCAATVAVIRQETGSWRWTLLKCNLYAGDFCGFSFPGLCYCFAESGCDTARTIISRNRAGWSTNNSYAGNRLNISVEMVNVLLDRLVQLGYDKELRSRLQ